MTAFFRQIWIGLSVVVMTGSLVAHGDDLKKSGSTAVMGSVSILAGRLGGSGNVNGTGAMARFTAPLGLATDSAGNVFVADSQNSSIRKITPAGVVTTFAGTAKAYGTSDGTRESARFTKPVGIATDSAGNVFVADGHTYTIRKITPTGVVTTIAGTAGTLGSTDGTGAAARFDFSGYLASDRAGNVFVADTNNHTIRKITSAGLVTTIAGTAGAKGSADGAGAAARFNYPSGLATDSTGNMYVADSFNFTIRKITPAGVITTLAGAAGARGAADGIGASARFNHPNGIAIDNSGNVFVADNNTIRKITPVGVVSTLAGVAGAEGAVDGIGAVARFNGPAGLAIDRAGNVFVADSHNSSIRKITPAGVVTTFAGAAEIWGWADGTGAAASFKLPGGLAVDNTGNIVVADALNHIIRKITPTGLVTTFAGASGVYGSTDGIGAETHFNLPNGVATDSVGNVFVADTHNSIIRKITPSGVVMTLAGTAGARGGADGIGAAASFRYPSGIATDSAGNVFVADSISSTIRKITPAGVVTTLAGTAEALGAADGTGAAANFRIPGGLATDSAGNVFVADTLNHTIRKITPAGVVSTLAGTAGMQGSVDGMRAEARFNNPNGIVLDSAGNVFVADTGNRTIRKVTPSGVVTTVAGIAGVTGVVPGPLPTSLNRVTGIAIDHNGMLYVTAENAVLKIVLP